MPSIKLVGGPSDGHTITDTSQPVDLGRVVHTMPPTPGGHYVVTEMRPTGQGEEIGYWAEWREGEPRDPYGPPP